MNSIRVARSQTPRDVNTHSRDLRIRVGLRVALGLLVAVPLLSELRTARLQSLLFSTAASRIRYTVSLSPASGAGSGSGSGSGAEIAPNGPYDKRLGYAGLSEHLSRVQARGFVGVSRASSSSTLSALTRWGLPPIYEEKASAGLRIEDSRHRLLYAAEYPQQRYAEFASIPPLVVDTLLFLENRELLGAGSPYRNPAIEWDRFARSSGAWLARRLGFDAPLLGGSTLATQIEKYRHWPGGRTATVGDKLRQMTSAALRAYLRGADSLAARRRIVLHYVNTVPLAAAPGVGEIFGLGEGMWFWHGTRPETATGLLNESEKRSRLAARAAVYKQVVSLLVALRRPSHYLLHEREALHDLTDRTLVRLQEAGVIDAELRDAALAAPLEFRVGLPNPPDSRFSKGSRMGVLRLQLLNLLGIPRLYDLDRLDLTALTTLDGDLESSVRRALRELRDPAVAKAKGLVAPHLLARGDPREVVYSFLLLERVGGANRVRVHVDTLDQPFDVNAGMKLDLGSTAKLRTLLHYLELVAALHDLYAGAPPAALRAVAVHPSDRITKWALDHLARHPNASLPQLLEAAIDRRYDADSREVFFTGGAEHRFRNFDRRFEESTLSLRVAFRHSVNLPFVRLMRDIVNHVVSGPG
ncbi:MAG: transglycosylase domain-containing protein, partial [Deltaproteobacteria bacterium]|nr:transglycosylase domain-containing protein [Deltaproteobacteria bacterium]